MRGLLTVALVCGIASVSLADVLSTARPAGLSQSKTGFVPTTDDTYRWDDGSSENSLGLTNGGEIVWINHFNALPGANTIFAVSTAFGTPAFPGSAGVAPGQNYRVYVWGDPNGDGNPADGNLMNQTTCQVQAAQIDTDVLGKCTLTNPVVVGNSFFIGASAVQPAGTFPAPIDENTSNGRSWVTGTSPPPYNPNVVAGSIGLFNLNGIGFPGVFMLRANAVPEPATMTLLGIAGLALLRRRS